MSIQKFRFDREEPADSFGVVRVMVDWSYGPALAGLCNCPCNDGIKRTVYVQGEPDTVWTTPAAVLVKKQRVNGYISHDEDNGYTFYAKVLDLKSITGT